MADTMESSEHKDQNLKKIWKLKRAVEKEWKEI